MEILIWEEGYVETFTATQRQKVNRLAQTGMKLILWTCKKQTESTEESHGQAAYMNRSN